MNRCSHTGLINNDLINATAKKKIIDERLSSCSCCRLVSFGFIKIIHFSENKVYIDELSV